MKTWTSKLAFAAAAILLTLSLPFFTGAQAFAQEEDGPPPDARPGDRPPNRDEGDLIRRLNLTPEQIKQIREIRESNAEEWRTARQRMMRAQFALDEAIYADNVDEADIEARARDLASAQAAVARLRAMTELRIRRVLTAEQLNMLRQLRQEAREKQRQQRREVRRDNPDAFQQLKRPDRPIDGKPGRLPPQSPPAKNGRRP
jgi:Spy/CpxP family protein refolding chaperone